MGRNVIDRVPGWNGGTTYRHVLERNLHLGWLAGAPQSEGGFFSRFFARPKQASNRTKLLSVVVFVTDGENALMDHERTIQVLEQSEKRGDQVYFLFMGACEHDVDFGFLRTIAERFKNTGVVIVRDLDGFVELSDEELNAQLLGRKCSSGSSRRSVGVRS